MRVVVTGGSGFIGTNLVEHYRQRASEVLNLDIAPPRNPLHGSLWRQTNILDAELLAGSLNAFEPDVVLHMAARTDLRGRDVTEYAANIDGVINLIRAVGGLRQSPFVVFASSMLVCRIGYRPLGDDDYCPTTPYGESKAAGERLVRTSATSFPWSIVRPTSIWGPWFGTPYRDFFEAVARGFYLHPKGRSIHRNYGFALNAVHQIDRLVDARGGSLLGRTAYLADYKPIELRSWATQIQHALHARPVRDVPLALLRLAARAGDLAQRLGMERPPITSFRLANLLTDCLFDTDPIRALAGPLPHGQEDAVAITCQWLRQQGAGS